MTAARLPETEHSPLVRTDFTDDAAWEALLDEVGDDWVTVLADPGHQGLSAADLLALTPDGMRCPVLVVADDVTFSSDERTLLLIDADEEPGRTFRVAVPDAYKSVIGNLAIQNQSFDDYLNSLDASGVYRLSARHQEALAALGAAIQPQRPDQPNSDFSRTSVPGRVAGPGASRARPAQQFRPAGAARPMKPGTPPKS